jgi:hypothetical protein
MAPDKQPLNTRLRKYSSLPEPEFIRFDIDKYSYIESNLLQEHNALITSREAMLDKLSSMRREARQEGERKGTFLAYLIYGGAAGLTMLSLLPFPTRDLFDLIMRLPIGLVLAAYICTSVFEKQQNVSPRSRERGLALFIEQKETDLAKVEEQIRSSYSCIKTQLLQKHEYWLTLSPMEFESKVADLFSIMGYHTSVTKGSGDGGIDIVMRRDGRLIVVQCKLHKKPVGPHVIRDLFGALQDSKADEAILVASAGFTSGCLQFAQGKPIALMALEDLLRIAEETKR